MTRSIGAASTNGEGLPLSNVVSSESGDNLARCAKRTGANEIGAHEIGANVTGTGRRILLRPLTRTECMPAAELAARGMIDDPILVRVFGPNPKKRQRRLTHYYAY